MRTLNDSLEYAFPGIELLLHVQPSKPNPRTHANDAKSFLEFCSVLLSCAG